MTAVDALRPFISRRRARHGSIERCTVCGAPVGERHRHLLRRERRELLCSCAVCAGLFVDPAASGGLLQTVPERVVFDGSPPPADWCSMLASPAVVAFFAYDSTRTQWRLFHPGPAGPVQAAVAGDDWERLASAVPLAREVLHDVEALLLHQAAGAGAACLLAPIDECYAIVDAVRPPPREVVHPGDDTSRRVAFMFERLRARATPPARRS